MELSLQKHNVLGESPETRVDSPAESASPRPEEMSINTKRRMTLKKRLKKFVSKGKKSLSGLNFPQTKRYMFPLSLVEGRNIFYGLCHVIILTRGGSNVMLP